MVMKIPFMSFVFILFGCILHGQDFSYLLESDVEQEERYVLVSESIERKLLLLILDKEKDAYAFIDRKGQLAIPFIFKKANEFFRGLSIVQNYESEKWGVINADGRNIIDIVNDTIISNANRYFVAASNDTSTVYDKEGNIIIPSTPLQIIQQKNSYDFFNTIDGDKVGLYYKSKKICDPHYDRIHAMGQDKYILTSINGGLGLMDTLGRILLENEYNMISQKAEDTFVVGKDGMYGLYNIDQDAMISNFEYEGIEFCRCKDGVMLVEQDDKIGVVSLHNEPILPIEYSEVECCTHKYLIIKKEELYGLISVEGDIILKQEFDKIENTDCDGVIVTKNNKKGYYNRSGQKIVEMKYDEVHLIDCEKVELHLNGKVETIEIPFN